MMIFIKYFSMKFESDKAVQCFEFNVYIYIHLCVYVVVAIYQQCSKVKLR